MRGDALLEVLRIKERVGVLEGGVRLDEVLGAPDELVILGRMVEEAPKSVGSIDDGSLVLPTVGADG